MTVMYPLLKKVIGFFEKANRDKLGTRQLGHGYEFFSITDVTHCLMAFYLKCPNSSRTSLTRLLKDNMFEELKICL